MSSRFFKGITALLFATTFGPAGLEKIFASEAPSWFLKQFSETPLGAAPALLPPLFYGLGLAELGAGLLMLLALITKSSRFYGAGLAAASLLFVALAFGQRLSHRYDEALVLFLCAVGSLVLSKGSDEAPN